MKLVVASIVIVGTVSAKTGSSTGLRGLDRRVQELDDEDVEVALAELFGDTPQVEDISQDDTATDTSQGFDINELVEDMFDSNGDSATLGDGFLEDLLGGSANGGDSTSSGGGILDFLGMDIFACSDKCEEEDKGICDSFMMSMNPASLFENACNTGCIPQLRLGTCLQFCSDDYDNAAAGDIDTSAAIAAVAEKRGMFDSLVQDLVCSDCKFYTCCNSDGGTYDICKDELPTDADDQAVGDSILSDLFDNLSESLNGDSIMEGVDIENIMEDLPDLASLFPSDADSSSSGITDTTTDWDFQELLDQMLAALGLEDMFSGMQDLFDETLTSDFETIADTVSCNPETCPIEGLCTLDLDFSSFKPDDLCTQNAFFECGDGLETLCSECTSGDREGMICSLCSIATCCKDGDALFQECALSSPLAQGLLQDDADAANVSAPEDYTGSVEVENQAMVESPEETSETPQDEPNADSTVTESLVPSQVISSVESAVSASSYASTSLYAALAGAASMLLF